MVDSTDISAYGCYRRACLARQDAGHRGSQYLLYALLELRYCIERYLFETLDLIRMGNLSKTEAKLWGAHGLKNAVLKADADFVMKLQFINLLKQADQRLRHAIITSGDLPVPDLDALDSLYGRIGAYLHAPCPSRLIIMDVAWWKQLDVLATEGVKCMEPFVHAPYARFDMNESGKALFDDFKSGRVSPEETLVRLRVAYSSGP
jgi:hypothetical protein